MSNQAFSRPEDLMVGAGTLYFKRTHSKDKHGFHHLGNSTGFTITTDIEKIDKNSSMNKHRELMASAVTSVKASSKITLEEYNPYNLALGLFGEESIIKQAAKTFTDEVYEVLGNPSIISLVDADGNKYMNVKNIVVKPVNAIPAKFEARSVSPSMTISTVALTNDTLTDTKGGTLTLAPAAFAGTNDVRVFITVKNAPNNNGDLDGLTLEVREGLSGAIQTLSVTTTKTTETFTLASGATIVATVGTLHSFTASTVMNEAEITASITAYKEGKDYVVDELESRGGLVKITQNGLIKTGDKVKVSFEVPEQDFISVAGGIAGFIEGELLFLGDPNNGGQYNIEGWKVRITPDGDLSGFISENEFGNFTLNVEYLSDRENHKDAPLYRATLVGYAQNEDTVKGYYDPIY